MKALILGAGGQLGSDLRELLPDASPRTRVELSILDEDAIRRTLGQLRPEVVFNCAAYNAVDRAETEWAEAFAVNAEGPGRLAALCVEHDARLVHFSTNFVFDGESESPYLESSAARPVSAYGESKLEGERRVQAVDPDALVVRSSGLFGRVGSAVKGGSFPERMLARARAGEPLRVIDDQRLNPTYTLHLAQAAVRLVEQGMTGVVHAVAEGCCSWYDLASETFRLAGLSVTAEPVGTDAFPAAAKRPRNGCLASERIQFLPSWQEGLREWLAGRPLD